MSIRQIEKLYKKMIHYDQISQRPGKINKGVRSEIFHMIMDDVERLQKKLKHSKPGTKQHRELDLEMRHLLLKEIQIIIDDYTIAKENKTLGQWEQMYGDINDYVRNFYMYRETIAQKGREQSMDTYGFYDEDDVANQEI